MHITTKKTLTYLIIYFITSSFYISRILTRYIFENANKFGWIIILGISFIILSISPLIYRFIIQRKTINKITRLMLYPYLILISCMGLIFLSTLINTNWLMQTRYIFILIPFLLIIYYVLSFKVDVLYRLIILSSIPILIQYLIYLFSQNKSMVLYALMVNTQEINHILLIITCCVQMVSYLFMGSFYMNHSDEIITKKSFYTTILFILFCLIVDSIIVSAQFGNSISKFPFIYYESWRLISFGQYIGYLDLLAFYYWVTSTFVFVSINLSLIKEHYPIKLYRISYLLLLVILLFVLTHGDLYHLVKPTLLISSSILSIFLIISRLGKG